MRERAGGDRGRAVREKAGGGDGGVVEGAGGEAPEEARCEVHGCGGECWRWEGMEHEVHQWKDSVMIGRILRVNKTLAPVTVLVFNARSMSMAIQR